MNISIKFLGMHRILTNTGSLDMPITVGTTVQDALDYIRQRYPELNLEQGMVLPTVNHQVATLDRILKDKDTVEFLPLIAGG